MKYKIVSSKEAAVEALVALVIFGVVVSLFAIYSPWGFMPVTKLQLRRDRAKLAHKTHVSECRKCHKYKFGNHCNVEYSLYITYAKLRDKLSKLV